MKFDTKRTTPRHIIIKMSRVKDKERLLALAGVAQWIECQPMKQEVAGSILGQGTRLGCRLGPQWGGV